jgi:hypothetical protein|tara:strand:+ start:602 stop:1006 length:405 start_codon:yes stop_codon:yes gene_type:complete
MKKPILFIQGSGIFINEILVCVGAEKKDIIAFVKKKKLNKDLIKWVSDDEKIWDFRANFPSFFAFNHKNGHSILFLEPFKDDWAYWEMLIHEIAHIVHTLAIQKAFTEEEEAKAYLSEYLFRSIRRILQKLDPI